MGGTVSSWSFQRGDGGKLQQSCKVPKKFHSSQAGGTFALSKRFNSGNELDVDRRMSDYGPERQDDTRSPNSENSKKLPTNRARQGISGQGVRYVLIASLFAVIIVMIVVVLSIAKHG